MTYESVLESQHRECIAYLQERVRKTPQLMSYLNELYLMAYCDGMVNGRGRAPWQSYENPFWPSKIWPDGAGYHESVKLAQDLADAEATAMMDSPGF